MSSSGSEYEEQEEEVYSNSQAQDEAEAHMVHIQLAQESIAASKADKLAKQRTIEREYRKAMAQANERIKQLHKAHGEKVKEIQDEQWRRAREILNRRIEIERRMWQKINLLKAKEERLRDIMLMAYEQRIKAIAAVQGNNIAFLAN